VARIATVGELMPFVGTHDEGAVDQDTMGLFLDGAERFAERWIKRTFSPDPPLDEDELDTLSPVTKSFPLRGRSRLIRVPDLRETVSATIDGSTVLRDTDFYVDDFEEPALFVNLVNRFTGSGQGKLEITGRWGPLVPDPDVKLAVLTLAARGYKRRDANFSDVLQTQSGNQLFWSSNMPEEVRKTFENLRIPNLLFA